MKYPQITQEHIFLTISDKINLCKNHELVNMNKPSTPNWESLSVEKAKIAVSPTYKKTNIVPQIIDNLESFKDAIQRMAKRSYQKMLDSEKGKKLIASADKYDIPYDKDNIDWLRLIDLVQKYEMLLEKATEHNLDWDTSYYDPMGLEQKIEDYHLYQSTEEKKDLYWYYLSTRL
jgi:hypothetical protein